jgi:exosortase/archaeosortase family protein
MPKISFSLAETFSQFSASQKAFLRNAVIAFLIWFPVADISFVHNILVRSLADNAALTVGWITGTAPTTYSSTESLTGYCIWNVADARGRILIGSNCDGWELYYLCAAFIIIFPGVALKRKALFALGGLAVMYVSNVLRIVALFFLAKNHPEWFQLFHKTIFQFIIYVIMFIVWIIYLRGNKSAAK